MKDRYVVDTNVLIAASSVTGDSLVVKDVTPSDPRLRQLVWNWLSKFEESNAHIVLDLEGKIEEEYGKNIGFNDYGRQVVLQKYSTSAYDMVELEYDNDGYAVLDEGLAQIIHDRSDRKMVAAAIEAKNLHGDCAIANAADTDWFDWEPALRAEGIEVEEIIYDWAFAKWKEKAER